MKVTINIPNNKLVEFAMYTKEEATRHLCPEERNKSSKRADTLGELCTLVFHALKKKEVNAHYPPF